MSDTVFYLSCCYALLQIIRKQSFSNGSYSPVNYLVLFPFLLKSPRDSKTNLSLFEGRWSTVVNIFGFVMTSYSAKNNFPYISLRKEIFKKIFV